MRISSLRLQKFRNISFAELQLHPERTFLLGSNGQGKSNLLEAIGLVTALRSFRTQNLSALVQKTESLYTLVYTLEHEHLGDTHVEIEAGRGGRRVLIDDEPVGRLADFIGRFPVVPLSAGDLQILRGSPAERRRFLDLSLSAVDPDYFLALKNYHRGLADRNRLLKNNGSAAEFDAFEAELASYAEVIVSKRRVGLEGLGKVLSEVYTNIAEAEEGPSLRYKPRVEDCSREALIALLATQRKRDQILGSTTAGPHRDDFVLSLDIGGASEYASDGQQRGLCVALRIAQACFFRAQLGVAPVILADDVLGELDPLRKAGFWRACPSDFQIIASGTEEPLSGESWRVHKVFNGMLEESDSLQTE